MLKDETHGLGLYNGFIHELLEGHLPASSNLFRLLTGAVSLQPEADYASDLLAFVLPTLTSLLYMHQPLLCCAEIQKRGVNLLQR